MCIYTYIYINTITHIYIYLYMYLPLSLSYNLYPMWTLLTRCLPIDTYRKEYCSICWSSYQELSFPCTHSELAQHYSFNSEFRSFGYHRCILWSLKICFTLWLFCNSHPWVEKGQTFCQKYPCVHHQQWGYQIQIGWLNGPKISKEQGCQTWQPSKGSGCS